MLYEVITFQIPNENAIYFLRVLQLIDHFRGMLDQIAVFFLQPTHLPHPLLDLAEGTLKVRGHLIERVGEPLDFIPCLELQAFFETSAPNLLS